MARRCIRTGKGTSFGNTRSHSLRHTRRTWKANIQKKRVFDLCDLLIEKPLGMQFNCAIRTGHTSDEMLQRLKQAGALMVSMGIESADPAMMERHKAGVTLEAVKKTVEQIHAAGLRDGVDDLGSALAAARIRRAVRVGGP